MFLRLHHAGISLFFRAAAQMRVCPALSAAGATDHELALSFSHPSNSTPTQFAFCSIRDYGWLLCSNMMSRRSYADSRE